MKRRLTGPMVVIAAAIASAQPVFARTWPSVAGWDVGGGDDFCGMFREYEGPGESKLAYLLGVDGKGVLSVVNYGWSAKEGEKYADLAFHLNGSVYEGGSAGGVVIEGRKGFSIGVQDKEFEADFTAASAIHIYKGEVLVDRLKLDGTSAALPTLKRCVAFLKAQKESEARERRRFEDIEKDPFAKKD